MVARLLIEFCYSYLYEAGLPWEWESPYGSPYPWEWEYDFLLWGSPYGYPYGDPHRGKSYSYSQPNSRGMGISAWICIA